MSQCLSRSGWRKIRSDCRHTCVSVSVDASYVLGLRRVRGRVRRCFCFYGKEKESPLTLDCVVVFFPKALADLIFLNILFNRRKLFVNTVHYILPLHHPLHNPPLPSRIWLISWRFCFDGKCYVSFHVIGIAQWCAPTQDQSFINWQVQCICAVDIFQVVVGPSSSTPGAQRLFYRTCMLREAVGKEEESWLCTKGCCKGGRASHWHWNENWSRGQGKSQALPYQSDLILEE